MAGCLSLASRLVLAANLQRAPVSSTAAEVKALLAKPPEDHEAAESNFKCI